MNDSEYKDWKKWTESCEFKWIVDPIHNGLNGKALLAHIGGYSGKFIRVQQDGLIVIGTYNGANPNIGEAEFRQEQTRKEKDFKSAIKHCIKSGELSFILDFIIDQTL